MSLKDFWDTSSSASDFLRSGNVSDARQAGIYRNPDDVFLIINSEKQWVGGAPTSPSSQVQSGCKQTDECPSGYACISGTCEKMGAGSDQGSSSPGGGTGGGYPSGSNPCDTNDPNSPCNTGGPDACQQAPTCGSDDDNAEQCCGERCCSFGSAASSRPGVHCFCGPCPPFPGCNDFCDAYLKSNGSLGPGCSEGPNGNSCGPCSTCSGGQCVEKSAFYPCWCPQGADCGGDCQQCSRTTGECEFEAEGCQTCTTRTAPRCPCGVVLPPITQCAPVGRSDLARQAINQVISAKCAAACKDQDDRCEPLDNIKKYCCFPDYGGDCTFPSCPSGTTQVGIIADGSGYGCVICSNPQIPPDDCGEPECNCHADCGNCALCSQYGKCYANPACSA